MTVALKVEEEFSALPNQPNGAINDPKRGKSTKIGELPTSFQKSKPFKIVLEAKPEKSQTVQKQQLVQYSIAILSFLLPGCG